LYEFCLGVSEAHFVAYYDDLKPECNHVWGWIVAASVFNIIISVSSMCYICCVNQVGEVYDNNNSYGVHLGQLIVGIWAIKTYFQIETSCLSFWEANAPELWTFVLIHYVMAWISIVIIIVVSIFFCYFMYGCYNKRKGYKEIQV
jgi:hypothetical protein